MGVLHRKPLKFEHIFVAVITFFSLFYANTFDISLLLVVCALRLYVRCLYRHLFLEDTCKKARVTQEIHYLNCGRNNSAHAIPVIPPFLNTITRGGGGGGGGVHVKKKIKPNISQLRALATHTPIWGRVAQGALELFLPQIR